MKSNTNELNRVHEKKKRILLSVVRERSEKCACGHLLRHRNPFLTNALEKTTNGNEERERERCVYLFILLAFGKRDPAVFATVDRRRRVRAKSSQGMSRSGDGTRAMFDGRLPIPDGRGAISVSAFRRRDEKTILSRNCFRVTKLGLSRCEFRCARTG